MNMVNKGGTTGEDTLCIYRQLHLPAGLCGPSYQRMKHTNPGTA